MTNGAAIGYMILAAEEFGIDADIISKLEAHMLGVMDRHTEDEAEEIYQKS